jgi:hypothetical protein
MNLAALYELIIPAKEAQYALEHDFILGDAKFLGKKKALN